MAAHWLYIPLAASTLLIALYILQKDAKRLPPGPKGRFLIGNLQDLPQTDVEKAKTLVKWRDDYGSYRGIMHLEILGQHLIVLNSVAATHDLMEKRAAIYSNRPRMVMMVELMGSDWMFSVISGERHKELRSVAQRYFLTQIKDWQRVQVESSRTLLRNLYASPNDWAGLVRLCLASSILQMCYGHEVTDPDDALLRMVQEALEVPARQYPVDHFPILKHYPSWLPGGGFHKDAAEGKVVHERVRCTPFNMVRSQMEAGTARPSFISTLLSQLPPDEDPGHSHQAALIRDAAALMYLAAMDTSVSLMYTFLGAMVLHPDIQHRAQRELDSVLDQERTSTFDDRSSLPFIECILMEVHRWNIFVPLGFPHMVTEEDEYLGYRIPKGSTVLGSNWAILRDPEVFPNPEQFDPCRFLAATEGSARARETIESTIFGWGKRVCPGRHVGNSAGFILVSHILACFDIAKPLNDAGDEVEPTLEFEHVSIFRRALPTPCRMSVRSEKIAKLLSRLE